MVRLRWLERPRFTGSRQWRQRWAYPGSTADHGDPVGHIVFASFPRRGFDQSRLRRHTFDHQRRGPRHRPERCRGSAAVIQHDNPGLACLASQRLLRGRPLQHRVGCGHRHGELGGLGYRRRCERERPLVPDQPRHDVRGVQRDARSVWLAFVAGDACDADYTLRSRRRWQRRGGCLRAGVEQRRFRRSQGRVCRHGWHDHIQQRRREPGRDVQRDLSLHGWGFRPLRANQRQRWGGNDGRFRGWRELDHAGLEDAFAGAPRWQQQHHDRQCHCLRAGF